MTLATSLYSVAERWMYSNSGLCGRHEEQLGLREGLIEHLKTHSKYFTFKNGSKLSRHHSWKNDWTFFHLLFMVWWLSISYKKIWYVTKAARTIFYGWRALLWARIVSDKKKSSHLSFFLFFPPTCWNPDSIFPKKWSFSLKIIGESVNLSLLFFLSTDISWSGIFTFYFFPSDMEEIPLSGSVIRRI